MCKTVDAVQMMNLVVTEKVNVLEEDVKVTEGEQ